MWSFLIGTALSLGLSYLADKYSRKKVEGKKIDSNTIASSIAELQSAASKLGKSALENLNNKLLNVPQYLPGSDIVRNSIRSHNRKINDAKNKISDEVEKTVADVNRVSAIANQYNTDPDFLKNKERGSTLNTDISNVQNKVETAKTNIANIERSLNE